MLTAVRGANGLYRSYFLGSLYHSAWLLTMLFRSDLYSYEASLLVETEAPYKHQTKQECEVSENIHTPPHKRDWKFLGVGVLKDQKA